MDDLGHSPARSLIEARALRFQNLSSSFRIKPHTARYDRLVEFKALALEGFAQSPISVALENCYGAVQINRNAVSIASGTALYGNVLNTDGPYYPKQVEDAICRDQLDRIRRDIAGNQVLDIACGQGVTTSLMFGDKLPKKYIGVDIVRDYGVFVARKFKKAGCEVTKSVTDNIMNPSFGDHLFWHRDIDPSLNLTGLILGGWIFNKKREERKKLLQLFYEKFQPGNSLIVFGDNTRKRETVGEAYGDKPFAPWIVNGLSFSCYALNMEGLMPSEIRYEPHVEETDEGLAGCMDMRNGASLQVLDHQYDMILPGMMKSSEPPTFIYPLETITGGRAYKLNEDEWVSECAQVGWKVEQYSYSRQKHPEFASREIKASLWRLEHP